MTTRFDIQAALSPIIGRPYRGRVKPRHVDTLRAFFRHALASELYQPGSEIDLGTVASDADEHEFIVPQDVSDDTYRAAALLEGIALISEPVVPISQQTTHCPAPSEK